jgi:hypothetical protein
VAPVVLPALRSPPASRTAGSRRSEAGAAHPATAHEGWDEAACDHAGTPARPRAESASRAGRCAAAALGAAPPPPPPAAPLSRTVVHCTPCAHSRAHEPAGGIEQAKGPRDGRTLGSSVPAALLGPAKQAGWNVESYPIPLHSSRLTLGSASAEPMFSHLVSPLEHFARGVGAAIRLACILVKCLQADHAHVLNR